MLDSLGLGNQINIGGNIMPHAGINITFNGQQIPTTHHHYHHNVQFDDSGDDDGGAYYEEEDDLEEE